MISYGPFGDTLEKKKISTYCAERNAAHKPQYVDEDETKPLFEPADHRRSVPDPGLPHPGYRGIQERGVTGIGDGGPLCTSARSFTYGVFPPFNKAGDSTGQSSFARTKRKLSL